MSKNTDKYIKAEKSSDTSRVTLAFFHSIEEAERWIAGASSYRIQDQNGKIISEANADIFNRMGLGLTADELVATAHLQTAAKRNFY